MNELENVFSEVFSEVLLAYKKRESNDYRDRLDKMVAAVVTSGHTFKSPSDVVDHAAYLLEIVDRRIKND